MIRLCLSLALLAQTTIVGATSPAIFPDQEEPRLKGTLEEMLDKHADVLEVISSDNIRLQLRHRQVGIHPEDEELDVFVTQLLLSLRKFEGGGESSGATLQDLQQATLVENDQNLPEPDLHELESAYRDVLETNTEPAVRQRAQHRLADIKLQQGEAALSGEDSGDSGAYFAESIEAYETLLRDYLENPLSDQWLYQLSKAYAFSGQTDKSIAALEQLSSAHPDSPHVPEAEFRKAESYFAAADYGNADLAYTRVTDYGEATAYYVNALYMQGWSRFKQGDYERAIEPLTATIDYVMPAGNTMATIGRGEREIVQDCLRALALTFSYLDGAQSIAQTYDQLGPRSYLPLLYVQLGNLYLAQERYGDSAETYKSYNRSFPNSSEAPDFQIRAIESYEVGGFPPLVAQEKQLYLEQFSFNGSYWQTRDEVQRAGVRRYLQQFMQELANYNYVLAQQHAIPGGQSALAKEHYQAAENYFQSFIENFPEDDRVPLMGFLLGETRFVLADYPGAIEAYEWVAYDFSDYEKAADAAYSAILAYEQLGKERDNQADQQRIDSELRFVATFDTDPRAPSILGNAAAALMQSGKFEQAFQVASMLVGWQPAPDADLLDTARLVQAHSLFELKRYPDAELAYKSALSGLRVEDERYAGALEHLAASIYRQGEQAVAAQDYRAAAQQFERVITAAPLSPTRINAQFDAAINYTKAGELEQANVLLLDFRKRFPNHALAASVVANLVSNYEQLEHWQSAAVELDIIAGVQPQEERQRQALYLSASYYDRSGEAELARQRYRSYANAWPQPFATRMEAMNRLAELYQQTGQAQKRRFWLAKTIAAHEQAGAEQSERSLYLAALSASIFAKDDYQSFSAIKLGYPIKASLEQKRIAMARAVAAYQKTEAYGVQQFRTLATYGLGRIYQQLGADLMASQRPGKIDALALEQYELLLEEQAYPFEEKAISIYETNTRRSQKGIYDEWVRKSFIALGELLPVRYGKQERSIGFSGEIY